MLLELVLSLANILVLVVLFLATASVIYLRWNYGKLESIPGLGVVVKPAFVGGSEVKIHKKIVHEHDDKNVKKYGKVFGYYEGREAQIYIADPDLIRQIFIKDFDHFHNKRILDLGDKLINDMMDLLPYEKWKPVRNFLTPILSTGKIRSMSVAMLDAIQDWMVAVKGTVAKNDGIFEPKRLFTALTADVIARCGFGTQLNSLHDPNNLFAQNMKKVFHEDKAKNFMLPLIQSFPFLMRSFPIIPPDALQFFAGVLEDVMKTRRANKVKVNDFVDVLNDMMDRVDTDPEWKSLGITKGTVISQALVFFIAAFKTTSTALSFFTYLLAANPEAQDKLVEEVDTFLDRHNGKLSHENIGELEYLSACMHETLRLYPPVIRLERVCNQDWIHKESGLKIPKGMVVQVPLWSVHHNEEVYENAMDFKPERFLSENKANLNQYAFLTFGLGPHNCVGMRFAKEEIMFAMVNLLRHYRFEANENTRLKFLEGNTFTIAVDPFSVQVVERNRHAD